jgi:hypothetical protein
MNPFALPNQAPVTPLFRCGLWEGPRPSPPSPLLRRAPAAPASDVVAQEALDHRVHLVGHLQLAEDTRSDGPAMHDGRQPLRHEMRRIGQWRGGQVERRHLALRRHGRAVEREDPRSA